MREVWAYVAGLLEVGGWIGTDRDGVAIQITAPREVCARLQRRTGLGDIYPKGRMYAWSITRDAEARMVLQAIGPFLSQARKDEIQRTETQRPPGDG